MDGKVLRDYRLARGLTQEQLAGLAGITAMTIHKWETEPSNPRLNQFMRVADVLGMKASELLCKMGS